MMDGYCVYQGDARNSVVFFGSHGHELPAKYNPADFFMKPLTINYPKQESDLKRIASFNDMYGSIKPQILDEAKKFADLPEFKITGVKSANVLMQFR